MGTLLKVKATTDSPPAGAASFSLTANSYYRVQMSVNQARSKDTGSDLPLILGQGQYQDGSSNVAINLLSGYEFKTGADTTQYPRIVAISHGDSPNLSTKHHTLSGTNPNATGVPRAINSSTGAPLVLTFSQAMDTASVAASRLTFTELT